MNQDEPIVSLKTIRCESCRQPIAMRGQDVLFYCEYCRRAYELRNEKLHLIPIEFKRYRNKESSEGSGERLPFWAFSAKLDVHFRQSSQTTASILSGLGKILKGDYNPTYGLKKNELTFYVPAWKIEKDYNRNLGNKLTLEQPYMEKDKPGAFRQIYYDSRDAAKLADYIFLSSEIEKPDVVERLNYTLDLFNLRLIVIKII